MVTKELIGKNIKKIRKSAGLTQEQFAEVVEAKKGRTTISNYENGIFEPPLTVIQKVADFAGVSIDDLFGRELAPKSNNNGTTMCLKSAVSKNIKHARKKIGLTQVEFANTFEISRGSLSQYESGIYMPPLETLVKIADAAGVSVDYLLGRADKKVGNEELMLLPSVNMYARAGAEGVMPDWVDESNKIPVTRRFLNGANPDYLSIMQVVGDSMMPTIMPNDWVIIDLVKDRMFHPVDGIYLISKDGSVQIKRLQFKGRRGWTSYQTTADTRRRIQCRTQLICL